MQYEFSNITQELSKLNDEVDQKIRSFNIEDYADPKYLDYNDRKRFIYKTVYEDLSLEYNNYFAYELNSIQTSIRNNKITNGYNVNFEDYIVENYKALPDLVRSDFNNRLKQYEDYYIKHNKGIITENFIYFDILSKCHMYFITPMKEYIETNYKEILIKYDLIPSPIKKFIASISEFYAEVRINKNHKNDWKSQLESGNLSVLIMSLNGFSEVMEYKKYLQGLYLDAKKYINNIEESDSPDELNKIGCR